METVSRVGAQHESRLEIYIPCKRCGDPLEVERVMLITRCNLFSHEVGSWSLVFWTDFCPRCELDTHVTWEQEGLCPFSANVSLILYRRYYPFRTKLPCFKTLESATPEEATTKVDVQ